MTKRIPQTPSFRLDGRRALVTGGSRGIGFACAAAFAQAGAHVTLAARSADDLEAAAGALRAAGAAVNVKAIDLGDIGAVEAWINAEEPFDVLFNNAGVNRQGPMAEVTEADFDYVVVLCRQGRSPQDGRSRCPGLDHPHVLDDGSHRRAESYGLCHVEARHRGADQGHGH
jgi:NADPH:quinone reductase-like Zn-dependent oxidoreductase